MDDLTKAANKSSEAYNHVLKRFEQLDADEAILNQQELSTRKSIDALLGKTDADNMIKYQMMHESLDSIKSKQRHLIQSRGLVRKELETVSITMDYDIMELNKSKTMAQRIKLTDELPMLLDHMLAYTINIIAIRSILDGMPGCHVDIRQILNKYTDNHLNDLIQTRIEELKNER